MRESGVSLIAFLTLCVPLYPSSQITAAKQSTAEQASRNYDAEVTAIIDKILKRGEGDLGSIKTSTWVPPSEEDLQDIRNIGKGAIPSLDRALDTKRPFQQFLVVRLLGAIGGTDIVAPLKRALEPGRVNSVRIAALAALRNTPDDVAIPIVQSAVHDADPVVAQRARDLITKYYGLTVPN